MSKKFLLFDHVAKMYYRGFRENDGLLEDEIEIWTDNVLDAFEFSSKKEIVGNFLDGWGPNFDGVHYDIEIPTDLLNQAKAMWGDSHMTLEIIKVYTY